jgi:sugar-phosphatase
MQLDTVVFDMDGLLINSEPCWEEAGIETLSQFGVELTREQYHSTTGLRTKEWIDYWFGYFGIDSKFANGAEQVIIQKAIEKIDEKALPMPGYASILDFFQEKHYKIGLATSSPTALIDVVVSKLLIRKYFHAFASAENLPFSKPHPQVFMDCLSKLDSSPLASICFEDSFNGLISSKAARMKCVIVPAADFYHQPKWGAADLKIPSLVSFGQEQLEELESDTLR